MCLSNYGGSNAREIKLEGGGVGQFVEYCGSNPVEIKSRIIENQSFKVIKGADKCVDFHC